MSHCLSSTYPLDVLLFSETSQVVMYPVVLKAARSACALTVDMSVVRIPLSQTATQKWRGWDLAGSRFSIVRRFMGRFGTGWVEGALFLGLGDGGCVGFGDTDAGRVGTGVGEGVAGSIGELGDIVVG